MGMTSADYLDQLRHLLPTGPAWPRDVDTDRDRVLLALANEFARIEAAAEILIDEADPETTLALLPEWESDYGLPDSCTSPLDTIFARRSALLAKVFAEAGGDMSPPMYVELAAVLGAQIEISEGIEGDDSTWVVTMSETDEVLFSAGEGVAGQALVMVSGGVVECFLQKYKPAHTAVIFL